MSIISGSLSLLKLLIIELSHISITALLNIQLVLRVIQYLLLKALILNLVFATLQRCKYLRKLYIILNQR